MPSRQRRFLLNSVLIMNSMLKTSPSSGSQPSESLNRVEPIAGLDEVTRAVIFAVLSQDGVTLDLQINHLHKRSAETISVASDEELLGTLARLSQEQRRIAMGSLRLIAREPTNGSI